MLVYVMCKRNVKPSADEFKYEFKFFFLRSHFRGGRVIGGVKVKTELIWDIVLKKQWHATKRRRIRQRMFSLPNTCTRVQHSVCVWCSVCVCVFGRQDSGDETVDMAENITPLNDSRNTKPKPRRQQFAVNVNFALKTESTMFVTAYILIEFIKMRDWKLEIFDIALSSKLFRLYVETINLSTLRTCVHVCVEERESSIIR